MIEVDGLRKLYGDLVAVDGVSFSAGAGEIFGLLGPNGAGKSTTISCMAGLGGCMWPIEITPEWMQSLSRTLPTGWVMDAMHRLVSFGQSPAAVLPHVAALLLGGLVLGWLAARTFRYQ